MLDEEAPNMVRWSREVKDHKPKQEKSVISEASGIEGMVIECGRRSCRVITAKDQILNCDFAPFLDLSKVSQVAVGDMVNVDEISSSKPRILKVLPRQNHVSRPGPKDRISKELVLAANVDQIAIIFSIEFHRFNPKLLDRYLVVCARFNISPLICLNKCDLSSSLPSGVSYLKKCKIPIINTSAVTGVGMRAFNRAIQGKKTILTGPSGVGKTTIIQNFLPDLKMQVQSVRQKDGKGRHTTSKSSFYQLNADTWIMDTPGLRELGMWRIEPLELAWYFPDFKAYQFKCRFRNCLHEGDDGCAIKDAVSKLKISEPRYQSYLSILDTLK